MSAVTGSGKSIASSADQRQGSMGAATQCLAMGRALPTNAGAPPGEWSAKRTTDGKIEPSLLLRLFIQDVLNGWSGAKQISLRLRQHQATDPRDKSASSRPIGALSTDPRLHSDCNSWQLITDRSHQRCHRRPDQQTCGFLPAMCSIHNQPMSVVDRGKPARWESDFPCGACSQYIIGTFDGCTSRRNLLIRLRDERQAPLPWHHRSEVKQTRISRAG